MSKCPELPPELLREITTHARVNAGLLAVCRTTRDATFELVEQAYQLNRAQAVAFCRVVYLNQNVFLTGGAGTGKSWVAAQIVDRICRYYRTTSVVGIVAPTGAAARQASMCVPSRTRVAGATIHWFFNVRRVKRPADGPKVVGRQRPTPDELAFRNAFGDIDIEPTDCAGQDTCVCDEAVRKRLTDLELLWLDEISMVTSDTLDLINQALQFARGSRRPWGGCQVLISGDFAQFPPCAGGEDASGAPRYAFRSPLWNGLREVELTQLVRQGEDRPFAEVLSRVRTGDLRPGDLEWINANADRSSAQREPVTTLLPTNNKCAAMNAARLAEMHGEPVVYEPERSLLELVEEEPGWRTRAYAPRPTDAVQFPRLVPPVALKLGAPVTASRNTYSGNVLTICNGMRGRVVGLASDHVEVSWEATGTLPMHTTIVKRVSTLRRQQFLSPRGRRVIARQTHVPLKLGFAGTLHAAQGATVRGLCAMDPRFRQPDPTDPLRKRWRAGHASVYVCLSRCTSIRNVRLLADLRPSDVAVCPVVRARFQRKR